MNKTFIGKLAQGAVISTAALTMLLALSGCGGGDSSSTPTTSSALLAGPATFVAFGNTPNTVGITGGKGPFRVTSSNTTVLPVPPQISGASFTVTPANVAADTVVTLTVTDSASATSTVTVTVTPATISTPLINVLPAAGSTCASVNNVATSAATLCEGETGTASVTLKDSAGAVIANRAVRFEVLTIGASLAATATSSVFSRVATVNTNAQGVATVSLRADVEATSEASFVRATDTVSTHRVDTWITILKQTNGASALNMVPTTGGMVGHYSNECPFVRREYSIYGGKEPYTVSLPANSALVLANETASAAVGSAITVSKAGGRFTVENADITACVNTSSVLTVTDTLGATTTGTYSVTPGSNTRSTAVADLAVSPPTLSLAADPLSTYCSSSSAKYTVSGGTGPYVASASIPQVSPVLNGGTSVIASFVSDAKWKMLKGQSATILVLDSAGKVAVATLACS